MVTSRRALLQSLLPLPLLPHLGRALEAGLAPAGDFGAGSPGSR